MAISETVYSPSYPNNTKTVTVDLVSRIPVGQDGDEKYILSISTTAYSNNTSRTSINPIYIYDIKKGWAQSHVLTTPISTDGGTLTIAIDETDSGAVSVTVASGTYTGPLLADHIETQLRTTASGSKSGASNYRSYMDAAVEFEDSRVTIKSGSVKSSYNSSTWSYVSSVHVTGGTVADELGFYSGYPNSYDLATTVSGALIGPASAITDVDDAIRYAIRSLSDQIDFTS
jgi:hypothetical protein